MAPPDPHHAPSPKAVRRRILRAAGLLGLIIASSGCASVAHHLRTVDEGQFYRSAQMPGDRLQKVIRHRGIRTVINLRGANPDEQWYQEERAACDALAVAHFDLDWTMRRLPEPDSLARFVALVEQADRPILVHCQGGTHRAGVASAAYVLIAGGDVDAAREEFGPFFNDAPIGRVLDLYEGSRLPFPEWVRTEYPALYAGPCGESDAPGPE
ncbi:MAG: tyrosine-protein phosphatase [Candidatus Hydrogenedentes bacterium]|nr:tyrosine-protein phosphatase [Candidatus Hydrogenedentota bacterium]